MQQTDINSLVKNGWAQYANEHMAFVGDSHYLSQMLGEGIKTDFVLCVICLTGKMQASIDGISQTVLPHRALICPINSLVTDYLSSLGFKAFAICASPAIFKDLYLNKQMWEYYQYVLRNHIVEFEDDDWPRFIKYYELMSEALASENRFQDRIIRSLWSAVIYEFLAVVDRHVVHVSPTAEKSMSAEMLSSRFMEMLAMSEGRVHSVAEFASRLFVTPKYLSQAIKQTTGKTALVWIHQAVAKEAERQLTRSNMSVKEVADRLNFPNASFFGKFVKRHLGDTPASIQNKQS